MLNITFTHTSSSGSSAKVFKLADGDITISQKVPNQAKQIIEYAKKLSVDGVDLEADEPEYNTFTYQELVDYIDANHEGTFTTSKGGTMRIVRYYAKLLTKDTGVFIEV
jgi:hypothetical protein